MAKTRKRVTFRHFGPLLTLLWVFWQNPAKNKRGLIRQKRLFFTEKQLKSVEKALFFDPVSGQCNWLITKKPHGNS